MINLCILFVINFQTSYITFRSDNFVVRLLQNFELNLFDFLSESAFVLFSMPNQLLGSFYICSSLSSHQSLRLGFEILTGFLSKNFYSPV